MSLGPFSSASEIEKTTNLWTITSIWGSIWRAGVPAGGQGAVDGWTFGLGDGVERVAVSMADHHLDGQQLVVGRTVTCQRRLQSSFQ